MVKLNYTFSASEIVFHHVHEIGFTGAREKFAGGLF